MTGGARNAGLARAAVPAYSTLRLGKLSPSVPHSQMLARRGLRDRLNGARDHLLTLVRSPAGFGKTTLLAQFWVDLVAEGERVAWLSCDEDDREPDRFVAHLATTIARADLDPAHPLRRSMERVADLPTMATLNALLNGLDQPGPPLFVILDDYHLAECRKLDHVMERIIRHRPYRLRLLMTTRARPGFPVSQLRAGGSLLELTEQDLRFSLEDSATLLGPDLAPDQLEVLIERTEGWPVAVQLARLWIARHAGAHSLISAFSGSAMEMADYLAEQVVAGLPDDYRDLLLATSIAGEVTGDLADHLTGGSGGAEILAGLVKLNAPVFPVPSGGGAFRYHPIFREFIEAQLMQRGRAHVTALHASASRWFAERGDIVTAVHHAVAAGETARAFELADTVSWMRQLIRGHLGEVRRILKILPSDGAMKCPRLVIALAALTFKDGNTKTGGALYAHAGDLIARDKIGAVPEENGVEQDLLLLGALNAAYRDHGVADDAIQSVEGFLTRAETIDYVFSATIKIILGLLYYRKCDFTGARAHFLASLNEFDDGNLIYGGNFVRIHLATLMLAQGRIAEAGRWLRAGLEIAQSHHSPSGEPVPQIQVFRAERYYLLNDLEHANDALFDALPAIDHAESWPELYIAAYRTAASIAFAERGRGAAEEVLDAGEEAADRLDYPRLSLNLASKRVHILLLAGDVDEARRQAEHWDLAGLAADPQHPVASWIERDEAAASVARLMLARGDTKGARALLAGLEQRCLQGNCAVRLLQSRLLEALALRMEGDSDRAVERTRLVLADSMRERLVRPFIDEGPAVRELLKESVAQIGVAAMTDELYAWVSEILIGFDDTVGSLILTRAEAAVLNHLRLGGSNKEIARRLSITDNAIKFHMRNIFRKLGVNTRQLALAMAERRGFFREQG